MRFEGDWTAPKDFFLETDIEGGNILAYQKFPGVRGLKGHLSMSRQNGNFHVDSTQVAVTLPQVFRAPLNARQAQGDIHWEKYTDYWLISGTDLRVQGEDAAGTGAVTVRMPSDKSVSPYVRLRVDFRDGNGAHAARYYPAARLSPTVLAWMERSFIAGHVKQGYVIYDGPIRNFPFRDGSGKFEVQGHVSRAVYNFLPGWEAIKQGEIDVTVNNDQVLVTGSGKLGSLDVSQVAVKTADAGEGKRTVHVSGKINGPLHETLRVLRETKPEPGKFRWLSYLPAELQATGEGTLNLDLTIPLGDAHSTQVNGEYRFLKNNLTLPGAGVTAEGVAGNVLFTEAGLDAGHVRARLMGGDIALTASQDQGELLLQGQGAITAQGLAPLLGPRVAPHVSGSVNWKASWRGLKDKIDLQAEAQVNKLKISLPPPLDFSDGLPEEKLIVRTEPSNRDTNLVLTASMGSRVNGKLIFARDDDGWRFTMGRVGLGEEHSVAPKDRGLHVNARIQSFDLDQWRSYFEGESTGALDFLNRVSVDIKSLTLFGRHFANQYIDFLHQREIWNGAVSGESAVGNVKFSGKGSSARLELELARLVLAEKKSARTDESADPRRLPTVVLHSKSFTFQNKALGELDFMAAPNASGWNIQRLNLTRPEMKLNVSGNWQFINNHHASEFVIGFNSSDMGKAMEAFGVPNQLAGGQVEIKSKLAWPGPPAAPQLATLNGKVEVSAKKGRFLQVKQGAGRLFGLLDFSAINRYLSFDFTPVFGKGFIYDQIEGQVNIDKGNALTHDFLIRGPATQINADGRIGLVAEDFDLKIELQPKLSNSVTLATWGVWGPQVAAVVLAAQKIFKKQIAAGTRITYVVKGPWDHPEITKSVRQHAPKNAPLKADE
ncbi:MAG: TIGR02099 family protein [Gammaproteobacteria bacterium]|nr:TIGR02099 family protein [Gammaproteobacteria bacterium]